MDEYVHNDRERVIPDLRDIGGTGSVWGRWHHNNYDSHTRTGGHRVRLHGVSLILSNWRRVYVHQWCRGSDCELNAWILPYYTESQSTIIYDVFGFSFDSPLNGGGDTDSYPPGWCVTQLLDSDLPCAQVSAPIYVMSLYGFTTPPPTEPPPTIGGIQVNGVLTNNIMQGTSGYMAIYGTYLDGATAVNIAGTEITITSRNYYSTGPNGARWSGMSSGTSTKRAWLASRVWRLQGSRGAALVFAWRTLGGRRRFQSPVGPF